jgi:CHAT domain-containing protein
MIRISLMSGVLPSRGILAMALAIFFSRWQGERLLEVGKALEGEISGGESHFYLISAGADQYLRLSVGGKSVEAVLFGPDGMELAGPIGGMLEAVTKVAGQHRLQLRAGQGTARQRYEIKLEEMREATDRDKKQVAAAAAFAQGERLLEQGTSESLRAALEKFQEALPLWRELGDAGKEGATLDSIGWINDLLGDKQKAIQYYEQALPLRRAANDLRGQMLTLQGMGLAYTALGQIERALNSHKEALQIAERLGDKSAQSSGFNNIGGVYWTIDEHQKALEYYERGLELAEGAKDLQATLLNNIGSVYRRLGDAEKALSYHTRALEISRQMNNRRGQAIYLNNTGLVYHRLLGDLEKALEYYKQSLELRRAIADLAGEAYTLNNISDVYFQLGRTSEAMESYARTLEIWKEVSSPHGEAETLNGIAEVYYRIGDRQGARDHFGRALSVSREVGFADFAGMALYGLARLDRDEGNLAGALAHIEAAINLIESQRARVISPDLRAKYLALTRQYYEFHIGLLARMGNYDRAFESSEQSRARSLLDMLIESHVDIRSGVDAPLLERERSLQEQINARARELIGANRERALSIRKALDVLTAELEEVRAQIRVRSPKYAVLTQPRPLGLKQVQRLLDSQTMLLEYSLADEFSFLWAVTADSVATYRLPGRAQIEEAARRVYELMVARNKRVKFETARERLARIARADSQYPGAARALSRMILGPIAGALGKKRLVIVAEGALQYIPFAALPEPTSGLPLINRHEIVSLPSASALALLRQQEPKPKRRKVVAVLADPVFSSYDARLKSARALAHGGSLISAELRRSAIETESEETPAAFERLPFARREAEAILALVPEGKKLAALDFAASRERAMSPELEQYKILHFATHGLLNSRHPELSGLVLSLVNERGEPQDGFLRAHQIYNLKLLADLVVLSSCKTALGKEIRGEGLVGLTRGFMYAGANKVVASLWDVNDMATSELMRHFYEGMLRRGLKPASALRAAQIAISRQRRWRPPYYWAAFILQGDWN